MRLAALLALLSTTALAQTLFDGGAPPLPIQKVDNHTRITPLQQTMTAADFNSLTNNIYLIEQTLLGDAGSPSYNQLGGWATALDCNFSTATPQILPTTEGTTFTACGVTWTRRGAAFDGLAVIDGGLSFFPDAGTCSPCFTAAYSTTISDQITTPLAALIPGFNPSTPIRASVWISGEHGSPFPAGGSAQGTHLVFTDEPAAHAAGAPYTTFAYGVSRASRSTNHGWESMLAFDTSNIDTADVSDTTLSSSAANSMRLVLPNGYGGGPIRATHYGTYSSGFPATWNPLNTAGVFSNDGIYKSMPPSNWVMVLGSENAFGTVNSIIGRVLLEYQVGR